jgi:cytochrome c-type biogenesis protein CcmF
MGVVCFIVATMVFGADPMHSEAGPRQEGQGLSPLLQHPAMLIHPPIVFLGYSAWAIPCALAISVLLVNGCGAAGGWNGGSSESSNGRSLRRQGERVPHRPVVGPDWLRDARPWALFAWAVLGIGILLGAEWSYEELGWGGYWAWDPVENGSLIPWLTGTVCLHGMMAWHFLGILKKTTLAVTVATFGLCNFATFLTRSGIFSSLHAFSQSPIGWMYLGLMIALAIGGGFLIVRERSALTPSRAVTTIWSREAQILISATALSLMAVVALAGTLSVALSDVFVGRRIVVGTEFYNNVLIPVGLVLMGTIALAPLLRWGRKPTAAQIRCLRVSVVLSCAAVAVAWLAGIRNPLALGVGGLACLTATTFAGAFCLDAIRIQPAAPWFGGLPALAIRRRQYAGFVIHLGFVLTAVGITGSSLGSRRGEVVIHPGESIEWSGRNIQFVELIQSEQPGKFIAEAYLRVADGATPVTLRPAQHFHKLQKEWTTEVAIDSTWSGDLYAILHNGEPGEAIRLTLVYNPLIRGLWLGGVVMAAGALAALWPRRLWQRVSVKPVDVPDTLASTRNRASELQSAVS